MRTIGAALLASLWGLLVPGSLPFAAESPPPAAAKAPAAEKTTETPGAAKPQAQNPQTEAAKTEPAQPAKPAKDKPAPAAQAATDDAEKLPPPPTSADKKGSPQRFTPSEQVRADFDVSFPIDI